MSEIRRIVRTIDGTPASDGAGVKLKRVLGTPQLDHVDPFLMLDEFRNENADDYIAGFPSHPHRGFETVTYMKQGLMRHEDSVGNSGVLSAGAIQWMTAGRGIIHSEMPEQTEGLLWGYQLWVNLPATLKMSPPRYQDIPSEQIPEVDEAAGTVRIIAGEYGEQTGVVDSLTRITYFDVSRAPGTSFQHTLPDEQNAFVYVYGGALQGVDTVGREVTVAEGQLGLLSTRGAVSLGAGDAPAQFLYFAGQALNEPVARMGPFVMNTRDELIQAVSDYRAGTLAT